MTAAESIHAYLESVTPHIQRNHDPIQRGPVTLYAPGADILARGDVDLMIKYPSDVVSVALDDYRDSYMGTQMHTMIARYADGNYAHARFPRDQRRRDELALIMRAAMEAAKA